MVTQSLRRLVPRSDMYVYTASHPRDMFSLQGLDSGHSAPVPMFNTKQVQEWREYSTLVSLYSSHPVLVYYQDQVIKRVKISIQNLGKTSSHQLLRRPFQVTWFSNQLAMYVISPGLFLTRLLIYLRDVHRCLLLWNQNHEWVNAITLAKSILIPLDVLNVLWPSPGMFS